MLGPGKKNGMKSLIFPPPFCCKLKHLYRIVCSPQSLFSKEQFLPLYVTDWTESTLINLAFVQPKNIYPSASIQSSYNIHSPTSVQPQMIFFL